MRTNLKKRKIKPKNFPSFLGLKVHEKVGFEETIISYIQAGACLGMHDVYQRSDVLNLLLPHETFVHIS